MKGRLITPKNFMYEAISENLYVGTAMVRRKPFTYGDVLPANPYGQPEPARAA